MFEREMRLYEFMNSVLRRLLSDMEEAQLAEPVVENGNPAAWILGHLAIGNDFVLRTLGEPRLAPAEWHKRFRPGVSPKDDSSPYPSKDELVRMLETGRERVLAAIAKADRQALEKPHGSELLKDTPVQTAADAVAHLITTHFAFHVGQISSGRRRLGRPHLI